MSEVFHTDKRQVRRSFGDAAASYDEAAVLQREVGARMLSRLDLVTLKPTCVLDAGSGTGEISRALRERYRDARLIELDLALPMLQHSRTKRGLLQKIMGKSNWAVCSDIESLPLASGSVELVCSNLAIQWLNEPDRAFREFHRVLAPEGLLMFSTFGPDTLLELRKAFAGADDKPHVNRFIDMHDLGDALSRAGFASPVMDVDRIVLTYDDMRDIMRDLKAIGAHNVALGRSRGLMGKGLFAKAEAIYDSFRTAGRLPATYEVVYGHAWKPAAKPALGDGRQAITFHPRALP
jgi:malonyl-CoA O-methyltransferase